MQRKFLKFMFRRAPVEVVSASGTSFFIFLVACAIGMLVWWYDRVNTTRWDLLQTLLDLPADIDRSPFQSQRADKTFEALRRGTAEATFTEAQLKTYLEKINKNSALRSVPTSINGTPVVSYSTQSLAWTNLPLPQQVGNRQLNSTGLLPDTAAVAPDLRVFCLAYQDPRAWNDPSPKLVYIAKACSELSPNESASFVVVAVVNVSARTLKIRVE